ncbi:MAG: hypothetical protein ACRD3O_14910 [Terriglobia bacterium]
MFRKARWYLLVMMLASACQAFTANVQFSQRRDEIIKGGNLCHPSG